MRLRGRRGFFLALGSRRAAHRRTFFGSMLTPYRLASLSGLALSGSLWFTARWGFAGFV